MKHLAEMLLCLLLCSTFFAAAQQSQTTSSSAQLSKSSVEVMVASWPQKPKEMALKLMTKYGAPNEATDSMLV